MSLKSLAPPPHLATSTDDLLETFYVPALKLTKSYDRGVGYFTSNWLRLAATGLASLAERGGQARIIASPKISAEDCAALNQGNSAHSDPILKNALAAAITDLESSLDNDTLGAMAWMIADGLLEFKVAVPTADLDGDFHDKFGIFRDASGDAIAFHGSPNDSERAFRNYESISIFCSWLDEREASRVDSQQARFEMIWKNEDPNLRAHNLPDAIRKNLIEFTNRFPRPYKAPAGSKASPENQSRWRHQKEAIGAFLKAKNGVLEMATGTGKTRTALTILNELHARDLIGTAVVSAYGTDLLDQWHKELLRRTEHLSIYRAYDSHREAQAFLNNPKNGVLLTSRQALIDILPRVPKRLYDRSLLICDEVHGMGSPSLVKALEGKLISFPYRLGLSATPEREYDGDGNDFIEKEIGPVIYRFGLKDAIQRGILCEFDYVELGYAFSDDDRTAVRQAIRRYHAKLNSGQPASSESMFQEIARIRKLSKEKLRPFREYLQTNPDALNRCLIFVETAEYGLEVQDILMSHHSDFHTYYGTDDRNNLTRFARGELDCLITCHRISEGIDIQSVNNIVLFASSRARLETVQRLGRCLRIDPKNPEKRALVVDFIRTDEPEPDDPSGELTADQDRRNWFRDLASTRTAKDS